MHLYFTFYSVNVEKRFPSCSFISYYSVLYFHCGCIVAVKTSFNVFHLIARTHRHNLPKNVLSLSRNKANLIIPLLYKQIKINKTRNIFRERLMSPNQPHLIPPIPSSAFAPAHIIIQDLGQVDISYQVWSKDL